jgi:recombination protein RecA
MARKKSEEVELKPGMDFADLVIADINSRFKSNVPPASYLHDPEAATHVKAWISTGCDMLDLAISNRHWGGLPSGKIVELIGLEGSGKSLLAASALATTQKKGGIAVLIDTESAATEQFFEALGLDTRKLVYLQLETLEDVYAAVERIIETARKSGKDVPITIVIDSIMGASTKMEIEAA